MPDSDNKSARLINNDIIFECEHCDKSLAIDYHGAGLTIQCPDCGKDIQVPIPDGMELSDIDHDIDELQAMWEGKPEKTVKEEKPAREDPTEQVNTLMTELEELRIRKRYLEKERSQFTKGLEDMIRQMKVIQTALDKINNIFDSLTKKTSDDTQEL